MISDRIGVDFEKDILRAMEGRITVIDWFEPPAALEGRARLAGLKLNDAKEFQRTLDKIIEKFPDTFEKKQFRNVTYYVLDVQGMRQRRRDRRRRARAEATNAPAPQDAAARQDDEERPPSRIQPTRS